jgi:hypothetical protein
MGWQFGSHAVVKRAFSRNFNTPSAVSSYFGPGWKFELDCAHCKKVLRVCFQPAAGRAKRDKFSILALTQKFCLAKNSCVLIMDNFDGNKLVVVLKNDGGFFHCLKIA